ncbi:hypothetical protein CN984_17705 [Bacillus cereus]|uniref:Uncharacterized protein n=1 Tax=Bacillus cereus TaxID=1396 RepID=A0A2B9PVY3_BACCE|nr:hypothetical protein [Bacillus cereus]PGO26405.1 hypothetical protein CN984_17705 [Bacillus cereus]
MKKNQALVKIFFKHLFNSLTMAPTSIIIEMLNDLKESETSIDTKIQKVNASLKETSQIIKELETELTERTQKLDLLQIEYERYSKLATIEQEKASALLSQVDHSVNKGKRSERWIGFWIGIASGLIIFVLGLILTPILTPWITNLLGISSK